MTTRRVMSKSAKFDFYFKNQVFKEIAKYGQNT